MAKPNDPGTQPSRLSQNIIERTLEHVRPDDRVLDIGCGTGAFTHAISQKASTSLGIDPSEGMIASANERFHPEEETMRLRYLRMDVFDPFLKTSTFDLITTFNVLHYVRDREQFYLRIHELLRPDGIFISSTAFMGDRKSVLKSLLSFASRIGLIPPLFHLHPIGEAQLMSNAGFHIIHQVNLSSLPDRFIVARRQ